jgi:fatty acid desaturase
MNYHTEHHMFAAIPCYNLKRLSREIAWDMPKPRTLIGAWREMREAYRRQRDDPSYQYDTPVPDHSDGAASQDPLAAGIGDLAPEGLQGPSPVE